MLLFATYLLPVLAVLTVARAQGILNQPTCLVDSDCTKYSCSDEDQSPYCKPTPAVNGGGASTINDGFCQCPDGSNVVTGSPNVVTPTPPSNPNPNTGGQVSLAQVTTKAPAPVTTHFITVEEPETTVTFEPDPVETGGDVEGNDDAPTECPNNLPKRDIALRATGQRRRIRAIGTDGSPVVTVRPSRARKTKKPKPTKGPNTSNCFSFKHKGPVGGPVNSGDVPGSISCNGPNHQNTYTADAISAAVMQGGRYQLGAQVVTSNRYPHTFGNSEGLTLLPACNGQTVNEFPILPGGTLLTGGRGVAASAAGTDRVLFTLDTVLNDTQYCGIITHFTDQRDGNDNLPFQLCGQTTSSTQHMTTHQQTTQPVSTHHQTTQPHPTQTDNEPEPTDDHTSNSDNTGSGPGSNIPGGFPGFPGGGGGSGGGGGGGGNPAGAPAPLAQTVNGHATTLQPVQSAPIPTALPPDATPHPGTPSIPSPSQHPTIISVPADNPLHAPPDATPHPGSAQAPTQQPTVISVPSNNPLHAPPDATPNPGFAQMPTQQPTVISVPSNNPLHAPPDATPMPGVPSPDPAAEQSGTGGGRGGGGDSGYSNNPGSAGFRGP